MKTLDEPKALEPDEPVATSRSAGGRYRARRHAFKITMYVFLIAAGGFILLPVGWMLTAALKPDLEPIFTPTPEWFPTSWWEWKNFRRVLTENMPFLR